MAGSAMVLRLALPVVLWGVSGMGATPLNEYSHSRVYVISCSDQRVCIQHFGTKKLNKRMCGEYRHAKAQQLGIYRHKKAQQESCAWGISSRKSSTVGDISSQKSSTGWFGVGHFVTQKLNKKVGSEPLGIEGFDPSWQIRHFRVPSAQGARLSPYRLVGGSDANSTVWFVRDLL